MELHRPVADGGMGQLLQQIAASDTEVETGAGVPHAPDNWTASIWLIENGFPDRHGEHPRSNIQLGLNPNA